jgi:hypothetical protein
MSRFGGGAVGFLILASSLVLGTTSSGAAPTAGIGGRVSLFPAVRINNVGSDAVRALTPTNLGAGQILSVSLLSTGSRGTARLHSCGAPDSAGQVVFAFAAGESLFRRLVTDVESDCLTATTDVFLTVDKVGDVAVEATQDRLQYVPLATPVAPLDKHVPAGSVALLDFATATPPEARAAVVELQVTGVEPTDYIFRSAYLVSCGEYPWFPPNSVDLFLTEPSAFNVAYVPLGLNTQLCAYSSVTANLRLRLLGWLSTTGPDTNALPPIIIYDPVAVRSPGFVPTTPTRILDTRSVPGPVAGKFFAGTLHWIPFGAGTDRTVSAVALNVTVDQPEASGFLTVYPCSGPQPITSSLNYSSGQTIANAVTVKLPFGSNVCIFTSATTQVIVDFMGGYVPYGGSGNQAVSPVRLLDTREAVGVPTRSKALADSTTSLYVSGIGGVPNTGVAAVTLNVTVDQPDAGGFVTVIHAEKTSLPLPT